MFIRQTSGVFQCTDRRCQCCQHLMLQDSYTFKKTNEQFFSKRQMSCSCDCRNLTYVVKCPTCKEEHIYRWNLDWWIKTQGQSQNTSTKYWPSSIQKIKVRKIHTDLHKKQFYNIPVLIIKNKWHRSFRIRRIFHKET